MPTPGLKLIDEWLVGITANENLLIFAQIMPFPIDVPIGDWRLLRLGCLLHALEEFFAWPGQSNCSFLLLLFLLLLDFLLLLLGLIPLFNLFSILLSLLIPQFLPLQLEGLLLLLGQPQLLLPLLLDLGQVLLVSLLQPLFS